MLQLAFHRPALSRPPLWVWFNSRIRLFCLMRRIRPFWDWVFIYFYFRVNCLKILLSSTLLPFLMYVTFKISNNRSTVILKIFSKFFIQDKFYKYDEQKTTVCCRFSFKCQNWLKIFVEPFIHPEGWIQKGLMNSESQFGRVNN